MALHHSQEHASSMLSASSSPVLPAAPAPLLGTPQPVARALWGRPSREEIEGYFQAVGYLRKIEAKSCTCACLSLSRRVALSPCLTATKSLPH